MNVFDATVENGMLTIGETSVPTTVSATGPLTAGIRPEHVVADENGPLSITVQMGEPLGANTLLHGRLDGTNDAFTISLAGVHHAVSGETIRFKVDPAHLHFFDTSTGKRIG